MSTNPKPIQSVFVDGPFDGYETTRDFRGLEIHVNTATTYQQTGGKPPCEIRRGRYRNSGTVEGVTIYKWEVAP